MQDDGFASVGKFANANVRFATLAMTEGLHFVIARLRKKSWQSINLHTLRFTTSVIARNEQSE